MSEFLAMDGYAVYVWPSFLITFIVLVIMTVLPWRKHRKLRRGHGVEGRKG